MRDMHGLGGHGTVHHVGDVSYEVGHSVRPVCQDQPPGPAPDGGTGKGPIPGAKEVPGKESPVIDTVREVKAIKGLADTWTMVCTAERDIIRAMVLQVYMLPKTRLVLQGVKRSKLSVLGAVAVEISSGGRTSHQIFYVTEESTQLILSRTYLGQLGVVSEDFHIKIRKGEVLVMSGEESNLGRVWVLRQVQGPQATSLHAVAAD